MVITRHGYHPTVLGCTGHVRVLEYIRTPIHPRAFAVPQAKYPIETLPLRVQIKLLRAPNSGGPQLLIHAGLENNNVVLDQMRLGFPQAWSYPPSGDPR